MDKSKPEIIVLEGMESLIMLFTLRATAEGYFVHPPSIQLDGACASFVDQICPHDGQSKCECQVVVSHVENEARDRLALVFHTHNSATEIFIDSDLSDHQAHFVHKVQQILHEEKNLVAALSKRFPS